jgi:DNA-binding transcriptional MocR family regulator
MTQEQLAETLGVGRTYVARVVGQLRDEGVIETRRGIFIIKDEAALHKRTCLCARTVENHFDIVLCGFRRLRPGIPIERGHAFRSKAATCSDEGGRGVVAGMRSWVRFS